jgi:hypothetical protein
MNKTRTSGGQENPGEPITGQRTTAPTKPPKPKKVDVFATDDEEDDPNSKYNAAMRFVAQGQASAPAPAPTSITPAPAPTIQPAARPTSASPQKITMKGTPAEPAEEEDEEDDELFEQLYKRTTYYISRPNEKRLARLVKKFKKRPGRPGKPKYELMEEALEYLFEKYGIE